MGLFDGFPFKSREQREKEEKRFKRRVMPFGEEGKQKVLEVLRQVTDAKLDDSERLWAYFAAKDKYEQMFEDLDVDETVDETKALECTMAAMESCPRMPKENCYAVLALVALEHGMTSLEEYPTRDVVLTVADEYSKVL